jgi:hypothetical protein
VENSRHRLVRRLELITGNPQGTARTTIRNRARISLRNQPKSFAFASQLPSAFSIASATPAPAATLVGAAPGLERLLRGMGRPGAAWVQYPGRSAQQPLIISVPLAARIVRFHWLRGLCGAVLPHCPASFGRRRPRACNRRSIGALCKCDWGDCQKEEERLQCGARF